VPGATNGLGEAVALAQAPGLFAHGGKSPELPVLVLVAGHPVEVAVPPDGLVLGVDHDDLEVLVGGVLAHPVRVHDAEAAEGLAHALLGHGLDAALELQGVDTLVDGLAVGGTFGGQPLPAAPADADAEYAET